MEEIFNEDNLKQITELISKGDISGWFNSHDGGPYLQRFQKKFAEACEAEYAFAVSSGSASIYIALRACGIGLGDRVAIPTYTHVGSVAPIVLAGASPQFIDCGWDGNISSIDLEMKNETDKRNKPKAIIVVHQLGLPCDMHFIEKIRDKFLEGAFIIEDASHALGAEYEDTKCGVLGSVGCFSVGGGRTKLIGTGEGGMLVTNDKDLASNIKNIRNHGDRVSDFSEFCFNFRMSDLNALLGLIQLEKVDFLNKWQIDNALYMRSHLPKFLEPFAVPHNVKSAHYLVGCYFNRKKIGMTRDKFLEKIKERGFIGGVPRRNVSGGYSKLVSDIACYKMWNLDCYPTSRFMRDNSIWIDWHRYSRTREEIDQLINAIEKIGET